MVIEAILRRLLARGITDIRLAGGYINKLDRRIEVAPVGYHHDKKYTVSYIALIEYVAVATGRDITRLRFIDYRSVWISPSFNSDDISSEKFLVADPELIEKLSAKILDAQKAVGDR